MNADSTISLQALGIVLTGLVALWALMTAILKVYKEQWEQRILLIAVCRHLDIDTEEILGKSK